MAPVSANAARRVVYFIFNDDTASGINHRSTATEILPQEVERVFVLTEDERGGCVL